MCSEHLCYELAYQIIWVQLEIICKAFISDPIILNPADLNVFFYTLESDTQSLLFVLLADPEMINLVQLLFWPFGVLGEDNFFKNI